MMILCGESGEKQQSQVTNQFGGAAANLISCMGNLKITRYTISRDKSLASLPYNVHLGIYLSDIMNFDLSVEIRHPQATSTLLNAQAKAYRENVSFQELYKGLWGHF